MKSARPPSNPVNSLAVNAKDASAVRVGNTALFGLPRKSGWLQNLARRMVLKRLQGMTVGELVIMEGSQRHRFGRPGGLSVTLQVSDARFYGDIAFGGSVGAGEAYMLGYWSADNLTALIRLMVLNQSVMDTLEGGLAWLAKPLLKLLHSMNRNTRDGSRRNIAAHYDLGNNMFQLFLDPTMMYSSGIFDAAEMTLEQASISKLERICQKLDLQPTDHVVEIGTGWGGFAIYAARHYGCRITTTTISKAQYDLAVERVEAAGLSGKINIVLKDYRELEGTFDKLVSIEMIEAVGYQFYDEYFHTCARLLKPEGMALIQAITIADQRYESAKRSVDFIQRYIFPGSCIPSVTALLSSATRASDLRLYNLEDIGPHYARTLAEWRHNFFVNIEQVRALGYPEEFIRMWEFYLCYCEGGFEERALGDVHLLLVKPGNRRSPLLTTLQ
ncbi:class I SAM-dependent methyltransferase [Pseudomethylobacillus aquaticus]|uniref:Class I SAM-dependent methyltransferase n=2 Tax=Pseudomethylobacillus aquaticus TaxID=2676064 RepID=A0A3N0V5Z6_9PROT|nr:class I SAM-dependent methyltransferase [Pseudomethylobacillus aquaticus]